MSKSTLYQNLRSQAEEIIAKPGGFRLQLSMLKRAIPEATPDQAERALRKAQRKRTGKRRVRSGSRPTFCVVASPDELEALNSYASTYKVHKATAFHDSMTLLAWLERHKITRAVLDVAAKNEHPENLLSFIH